MGDNITNGISNRSEMLQHLNSLDGGQGIEKRPKQRFLKCREAGSSAVWIFQCTACTSACMLKRRTFTYLLYLTQLLIIWFRLFERTPPSILFIYHSLLLDVNFNNIQSVSMFPTVLIIKIYFSNISRGSLEFMFKYNRVLQIAKRKKGFKFENKMMDLPQSNSVAGSSPRMTPLSECGLEKKCNKEYWGLVLEKVSAPGLFRPNLTLHILKRLDERATIAKEEFWHYFE